MQKQKPNARLENWAVVAGSNIASYQALGVGNLLVGKVFGHPRIDDGTFIFTSPVIRIDGESRVAETTNTAYCLGEASRDYKNWEQEHATIAAA